MRLVLVEWVDTRFITCGWFGKDEAPNCDIARCVSIGCIRKTNKGDYIMMPNMSDSGTVSECIVIPKGCIKRIRQLKVTNETNTEAGEL